MRFIVNNPGGPKYSAAALAVPLVQTAGRSGWWGSNGVTGGPRMPRHAPAPGVQQGGEHGVGRMQPSHFAPDEIMPSQYWQTPNASHYPPVRVRSNNELPVPAGQMYNLPRISVQPRRAGGRSQVFQPGVAQVWPDRYTQESIPRGRFGFRLR